MYVHLGNGRYIRKKEIVGVFDMDTATICVATRRFLSERERDGAVLLVDEELPKSFLLLSDRREARGSRKKVKGRRQAAKNGGKKEEILLSKFSSGVMCGRTALSAMMVDTVSSDNG